MNTAMNNDAEKLAAEIESLRELQVDYAGQISAINKAQAVIEFDLDGNILNANDNFLNAVGYTLAEVKGQHHSMFAEPEYARSAEYKAFWAKLKKGEFDSGEYKRLGKGGKEIWIQASYNPIFDANGNPFKVVKYASDVTAQKLESANFKGQIEAINKAQAVIEFNMDGTIITANDNFLSTMGYSLDEVVGQHHSMFAETAYANSIEYKRFWEKLNQGDYDAGEYRRFGKNNKEIWIQASYNPILNMNGEPYKVVKFATDVTEQKRSTANFEGQIAAISKLQAIIEFELDGTIITANENFLSTMGYSLDEIRGKHHSMFADAAYANSAEYKAFWQKLNRGEYDAGEYLRYGKGGKEVWIQASYNPILDMNGEPYKVVKFATDITTQKDAQSQIQDLINSASQGDLSKRIDAEEYSGFIKNLSNGINQLIDAMVGPLHECIRVVKSLSDGNLTQQMSGDYSGEFADLSNSVNTTVQNLQQMVGDILTATAAIAAGAAEISEGNNNLSQRTEEQASSLEETAASMEELTSTVQQSATNAQHASTLAADARGEAEKGGNVVNNAITAMAEINNSSKKIADIITVIDEIAFQTNLLALNAAVEAARAGEHGRGFAVVASEVRNLAGRTADSAKEIKHLIKDSVQKVDEGSSLVNESGETLQAIVNAVKKVSDIIAEIAAASQEQSTGIQQVNQAVTAMDEMTQKNAALVEEAAASSELLDEQSRSMDKLMKFFTVDDSILEAVRSGQKQSKSEPGSSLKPAANGASATKASAPRAPVAAAQADEWENF